VTCFVQEEKDTYSALQEFCCKKYIKDTVCFIPYTWQHCQELPCIAVAYPRIFFGVGGFQQIQLRTEGRQNEDLGAVAP
jgi:hypothetical protein